MCPTICSINSTTYSNKRYENTLIRTVLKLKLRLQRLISYYQLHVFSSFNDVFLHDIVCTSLY